MGLVLVLVDAFFVGYDAVPDVLGWVLVCVGVHALRHRLAGSDTLLGVAALAGVISAVLFWPSVDEAISESGGWILSVPQLVFCVILCGSVADLADADNPSRAARFRTLRWVFVALAVAPVLLYGGGLTVLRTPIAVVAVVANVYLVYLLFMVSKKTYALP